MLKLETKLHNKENMQKVLSNLWEVVEKHPANEKATLNVKEMIKWWKSL